MARFLQDIVSRPKVVALGEIGLDYSKGQYEFSDAQKEVFTEQLTIAVECKKLLVIHFVIHCRDAERTVYQ
jgi:TatD DNase family protein